MFGKSHSPEAIAKMRVIKQEHGLAHRREKATNWKGGEYMTRGYRVVMLSESEAQIYASMAKNNYVPEHRLRMARKLGRPLLSSEVVHHRNGVKTDNRLRNLELTDNATHKRDHQAIVRELRRLRRENELLRSELRRFQTAG